MRTSAAVLLTAAALVTVGCAPQLDRIELSVQENHDEIAAMQAENKRLMQEMQALGQLLRMDRESGDESSAMRLAKLSMVSTRLDQLMRKLDDNAEYMRDLSARVDLLATRQGIPTLGEYKPPSDSGAGSETLPEEGRSIFEAAQLDRNRGNVDLARAGFEDFLGRYDNSELTDDALYWLGDLAYGEGENEQALASFQDMLARFPDSELASAAMFKSRACLKALGREADAEAMGALLLERYPDSAEAELLQAESGRN
jgi:TolA-binding protein